MNNKKLIQKINELKRQPIIETKKFQQRAEILTDLGGIKAGSNYNRLLLSTVKNILFSRYYGIGGLIKTMKGMAFCQNALIPELNDFNLFILRYAEKYPIIYLPSHDEGSANRLTGKEIFVRN